MDEKNLKKLQKLLAVVDEDTLTRAEFTQAFKTLQVFIIEVRKKLSAEDQAQLEQLTRAFSSLRQSNSSDILSIKEEIASVMESVRKSTMAKMAEMDSCMAEVKDGKDADEELIVGKVLEQIEIPDEDEIFESLPAKGALVRQSLEALKDNDRLDKSAVKGIEGIEEEIKNIKSIKITGGGGGHGGRGVQLKVDGVKKGLAQEINLIPGAGITISYSAAYGRNDITITATGTAALTPIAMTGTINDTNVDFTAASEPSLVIINGASYRHGKGVTIAGTTITLDNPVGVGGDLYGL